ncbi:ROK family protein [Pararhizobium sp.]|uniref:ROK family protein n=1 Tax=Pararhizobium sp. TaxID=1977563 RepID=UPI002719277A|nr:ROK family protein [Pararhizobium sp.]MDO9414945.1 ROK family protein [Pararhizobium sp.]
MLMKSSSELVRQQNSMLVLEALRRHGPLAHTDLSGMTGLSSATISAITADMERARIIEKSEQQTSSGRGRPRVFFSQRRDCGYLIVVRISSDIVQYSLVDYSGTLMDRFEEARNHSQPGTGAFVSGLIEALDRLVRRSSLDRSQILSISLSSKGLVEPDSARLVWSPAFGDARIDFRTVLASFNDANISLVNETLLVAQAIAVQMEAKRSNRFRAVAALSLGHSIGLGVARRDRYGAFSVTAPNFGHMLHNASGGLCRCGSRGCIEASAGFYGILRTAFEAPADAVPAKFVPLAEMDKLAASARQGNRMAGYAFRQAGLALGLGLSRMLALYERMPIAITGLGTRYYDLLSQGIEEGLAASLDVRLNGLPDISVLADEQGLVFAGHVDKGLTQIDQDIAGSRIAAGA